MDKSSVEIYQERLKRIQDAIELRVPDRVPFAPYLGGFAARYANLSIREAMYDNDKLALAVKKLTLDLQPDVFSENAFRGYAIGPVLELLDYKQLNWPGHGLPLSSNVTYQFVEGEYMKANEYDAFILDPSGFLIGTILPRICGELESLKNLPAVFPMYYHTLVGNAAVLGQPDESHALETLLKAGAEAYKASQKRLELRQEMESMGFPHQFGSGTVAPFDYLGDYLRGTKGIMLDMYRNPEKLLEAIDKITKLIIVSAKSVKKMPGVHRIMIPLHKGLDGFMSEKQFKTFFWPSLKQIMLAFIEAGLIPNPLFEGDCTSRLEIIADMPKGKCVYWFERTDVFKAKEILGNHICIEAGVPSSLLCFGNVEEVKGYCKKLIDVVGKGGGLIINGDIGLPDEAKIENVFAMAKYVKEYGIYK